MRVINYDLTDLDETIIKGYSDEPFSKNITKHELFADVLAILNIGPKYILRRMFTYREISAQARASKVVVDVDGVLDYRRSMLDFACGHFVKYLYNYPAIQYKEKAKILLDALENYTKVATGNTKQSTRGSKGSKGGKTTAVKARPMQNSAVAKIVDNISKAVDVVTPPDQVMPDLFDSPFANLKDCAADGVLKLKALVNAVLSCDSRLFELAHNFEAKTESMLKESRKDAVVGNSVRLRKMTRMSDINLLKHDQWCLPDEVFDVKFLKKQLIVEQPVTLMAKKQRLFMICDLSSSMEQYNRMTFQRAMMLALGKDALSNGGEIGFLWFNNDVSQVYNYSDPGRWPDFLADVLTACPYGYTYIHKALYAATDYVTRKVRSGDMDETEILLITDGTEKISSGEIRERLGDRVRSHCILLERPNDAILDGYRQSFDTVGVINSASMEEATQKGLNIIDVMG